jgi:hypothetical protein
MIPPIGPGGKARDAAPRGWGQMLSQHESVRKREGICARRRLGNHSFAIAARPASVISYSMEPAGSARVST